MRLQPLARAAGPLPPLLAAIVVAGCAAQLAGYMPDPPLPTYRLAHGEIVPPEVEGPVSPPLAMYRMVLDSVAARVRVGAGRGVAFYVDPAGLPPYISRQELTGRGLRVVDETFRCRVDGWIGFGPPRRFADGTYLIHTLQSVSGLLQDYDYAFRVEGKAIVPAKNMWTLGGLDALVGCPNARG